MINIEIWASGAGSNAAVIMDYFQDHDRINVARVAVSKSTAGAIEKAESRGVDHHVITSEELKSGAYLQNLKDRNIDYIILAGFLKLVPRDIVTAFRDRMLNIHPALLPDFGGKNMYGDRVHQAVIDAGVPRTGITIHKVNEEFDKGEIIGQFETGLKPSDSLEAVKLKVQRLEHEHYPKVIEQFILTSTTL